MTNGRQEDISRLLAAARESRLVIFVGAGASMGAPTNLPSWRDVNQIVVRSLAATASRAIGRSLSDNAAQLILARHAKEKLPPEYQAQLLAEFLGDRYFEVLKFIDSDRPNPTHLAIAWLARLGCVRAIITTNFDRVIETAFTAVGARLTPVYQPEQFRELAANLHRLDAAGGPRHLLKLHGSVDDPQTLIDTLAQRKKGFAPAVMTCAQYLLDTAHWLFLGFSGLDVEAEPSYLSLNQRAGSAVGFTWVVRENTEPRPAVVKLRDRYGDRGAIVHGELPDWLLKLTSLVSPKPEKWITKHRSRKAAATSPASDLESGARAWAEDLSPVVCGMSLGFVVSACAEPHAAASVIEALLGAIDERWPNDEALSDGVLLLKAVAANALGIVLAGLGRHEEAVRWLTVAVDLAQRADDDDTRDRFRGNLAASLETLGQVDDARTMYESALEGYRLRRDPVPLAFGLTSLASHHIRQMRLDDARLLAAEAVEYSKKGGDERLRGTALNDLGMIAKLRGEYAAALEIFHEVEELFLRLGNDEAAAAAAGNRGEVLAALGRYDEAERIQRTVLEIEQRLDRLDNQGATCLSLGVLNRMRGDAATAEQWYVAARDVFRAIKDPSNEALALFRLATLKNDLQQFEEGVELAQTALPLVSGRNPVLTADLWSQIGRGNLHLGYVVRAEEAFRETIALAHQAGATNVLASAAQNLGTALLLVQRDREAAEAFAYARDLWEQLGDENNIAYCNLGQAAVELDERVAALSDAGHSSTEWVTRQSAAREMLGLYPDLIGMYQQIGAWQLVAAFCVSAGSTAEFVDEIDRAVEWFMRGGSIYRDIGVPDRARNALERGERLLQYRANALLQSSQMEEAVPYLLQLARVSEQVGNRQSQATALYNAAIGVLQTSQDYAKARELALSAAELFDPDSSDATSAMKIVTYCEAQEQTPPRPVQGDAESRLDQPPR